MRIILILTLFTSSFAQANCEEKSSCDYTKEWSGFTRFVATYSATRNGDKTEFEYFQTENELVVNVSSGKGITTLFSINGVGTLYKNIGFTGFKTSQECYSDVGDTYAILQGYAVRALYFIGVGSEVTPETIDGKHNIQYKHKKGDSRVQINPGDHMSIGSPWSLSGSLEKKEDIAYDIHHKHTVNKKLEDLFVSGLWSNKPVNNGIADDATLNDWLICIDGKYNYEDKEPKFEPYIADTSKLKMVGQLRALSRAITGDIKEPTSPPF